MGNATNILCPRCKEQEESQHYFNLLQASQNYSETSKLSQNDHNGTSFQIHDGAELKILPILISEILPLNWT